MADIFNMADEWTNAGTTFSAIKMNVTDTASADASLLMDLQVGGVSKFNVRKDGFATASAGVNATGGSFWINSNDSTHGVKFGTAFDVILVRDAANTLAHRNGTAAQASRLYFSYTDASNYTRLALKTATGVHTIEAESAGTGEANIDLALTPKGTGNVRFGTHTASGDVAISGYVTIKDSGGVARKLAVIT